jgi:hypothetical protein
MNYHNRNIDLIPQSMAENIEKFNKMQNQLSSIDFSKTLSAYDKVIGQFSGFDFSRTLSAYDKVFERFGNFDFPKTLSAYDKAFEQFGNFDFSKTLSVYDKVFEQFAGFDFSRTLSAYDKAFEQFGNFDFSKTLSAYDKVFERVVNFGWSNIFERQNRVIKQIASLDFANIFEMKFDNINNISLSQTLHSAFENITEQYIYEKDIDEVNEQEDIMAVTNTLFDIKPTLKYLSPIQEEFFKSYIYPFILMLIPLIITLITSKPSIINNTYSSNIAISYVSNYYASQQGYGKEFLNSNNLRIICSDKAIVKKNHDCSSAVINKLPIGKVVCVIEKYKKWLKVSWSNDSGQLFSGWLQNYKLIEFK